MFDGLNYLIWTYICTNTDCKNKHMIFCKYKIHESHRHMDYTNTWITQDTWSSANTWTIQDTRYKIQESHRHTNYTNIWITQDTWITQTYELYKYMYLTKWIRSTNTWIIKDPWSSANTDIWITQTYDLLQTHIHELLRIMNYTYSRYYILYNL